MDRPTLNRLSSADNGGGDATTRLTVVVGLVSFAVLLMSLGIVGFFTGFVQFPLLLLGGYLLALVGVGVGILFVIEMKR